MYLTEFDNAEGVNNEVEGGKEVIVVPPLTEKSIKRTYHPDYWSSSLESGTLGAWYFYIYKGACPCHSAEFGGKACK